MNKIIYIVESRTIDGNTYTAFDILEEAEDFAKDELSNGDCEIEIRAFDWSTGQVQP